MNFTFGMVGGGGIAHRHLAGAAKGGGAVLAAGCFSRNEEKNRRFALENRVDPSRVYGDFTSMAREEAARANRPDFIVVNTANVSHYPICKAFLEADFPVMCEKPLTVSRVEADELTELAATKNLPCCVTYTYAGNRYIHLMRALLDEGVIGNLYYASLRYFIGGRLGDIMGGNEMPWRWDPDISGPAGTIGDLGAHLEYLLRLTTGRDLGRVLTRLVMKKPGDIKLDSTGSVLFEMRDGLDSCMQVAQLACGYDNDIRVELFGDAGSMVWNFSMPNQLRVEHLDGRTVLYHRPGLTHPAVERFPDWPGMDAANSCFANIYSAYCAALAAKRTGETPGWFPTFEDGRKGVRFIHACVASHNSGGAWIDV